MSRPLALIIEDDPQLGQIFTITLQAAFEIELISNGFTALARLSQIVPAIIILDLNLPGYPGRKLLTKIRTDQRLSATKVMLCTADARQAEILRDDAEIVLLKPVSPGQLRELAARLI
jgi:two-component system response regulator TctD